MEPTECRATMDSMIAGYIDFCIQLENKFEGITKLVCSTGEIQMLEDIATAYYWANNLPEFINCVNHMRKCWAEKSSQYVQQELL